MSDLQTSAMNEEVTVKKLGFFQRVAGVVVSPGRVMEDLKAKPRLLFPLILMAVVQLAVYLIRLPLWQDSLRKAIISASDLTESLTGIEMTPELIEQSLSQSLVQSVIVTPLTALFGWLFITVVLFVIVKIAGRPGKFKQYLSVAGYAYVITALYLLIVLGVSYFTGSLHTEMPLTSIANVFGEEMQGSFVFGMLRGLDVFKIWYYAVIAIGLQTVSGLKKPTAYGIVAAIFIIGLLFAGASEAAVGAYL